MRLTAMSDAFIIQKDEYKINAVPFDFCSQYEPCDWYDQLGGNDSLLTEASLDRIKHNAYKINIVPTNPSNYRSMREVY